MFLIGLVGLLLAVDQGSKWLVAQNLAVGESWAPIPALSKVFTITHVRNTGVSFGQLAGFGWLFMLVNMVVLIGVLIYYPRIPAGQWPLRLADVQEVDVKELKEMVHFKDEDIASLDELVMKQEARQ